MSPDNFTKSGSRSFLEPDFVIKKYELLLDPYKKGRICMHAHR